MALTLGNWILIGIIAAVGVGISLFFWLHRNDWGGMHLAHRGRYVAITLTITIVVIVGFVIFFHWWHTSTASGVRSYKDFKTNLDNGLVREVTITAEDGREIFHYEGKIDIEDNENYILFEGEDGRRYIIYYGKLDTVMIIEK